VLSDWSGQGAQAVTQLYALSQVFNLKRVLVHDTNPDHAASFPDRVVFLGVDVQVSRLGTLTPGLSQNRCVKSPPSPTDLLCWLRLLCLNRPLSHSA
jgi:hypothetical protein